MSLTIKNLIAKKAKSRLVGFPGIPGFRVRVAHLSRERLKQITDRNMSQKLDKRTLRETDELDNDGFRKEYVKAALLGWEGLTLKALSNLVPMDVPEGSDLDMEIEFSLENAEELVLNSIEFDAWLMGVVGDVQKFNAEVEEAEQGN